MKVPYKLLNPLIRCCSLVIGGKEIPFAGSTYQVPADMEQTFLSVPHIAKLVADGDMVRAKATGMTKRPPDKDPFTPCDEKTAKAKPKAKTRRRKRKPRKQTDKAPAVEAPLEPVGQPEEDPQAEEKPTGYGWFSKREKFDGDDEQKVERVR